MEKEKLLMDSGLTKNEAKILNYFFTKKEEILSRNLERELDLQQPAVSIILNRFIEKNWISYEKKSSGRKGHPTYIYTLAKDKQGILAELIKYIEDERVLIDKTIKGLEDWKNS